MIHGILSLLIVLIVVLLYPMFSQNAHRTQMRWFLREGVGSYQQMVSRVLENKIVLTTESKSLENIVGRSGVYGRMFPDGSIMLWFSGRGGYLRAGYLYYSGPELVLKSGSSNLYYFPEDSNEFYLHITNRWYSY